MLKLLFPVGTLYDVKRFVIAEHLQNLIIPVNPGMKPVLQTITRLEKYLVTLWFQIIHGGILTLRKECSYSKPEYLRHNLHLLPVFKSNNEVTCPPGHSTSGWSLPSSSYGTKRSRITCNMGRVWDTFPQSRAFLSFQKLNRLLFP